MALITFADYEHRYPHVAMERRDGVLLATLHTSGGELKWNAEVHEELSYVFYDIARDQENRCVILAGSGDAFCASMDTVGGPAGLQVTEAEREAKPAGIPSETWDHIYSDAKYLLMNLLNIDEPTEYRGSDRRGGERSGLDSCLIGRDERRGNRLARGGLSGRAPFSQRRRAG